MRLEEVLARLSDFGLQLKDKKCTFMQTEVAFLGHIVGRTGLACDGMLARWYLLLGQFSVTFEYRPGSLHSNADGMSRQCGQCRRPDCPVSAVDLPTEMGDSMDSDLLPELSGETWVASALLDELTWDLPTAGADNELVTATCEDKMLQMARSWVESGNAPLWPACAGLAPELRCWRLQVGNLKLDSVGRLWRRRSPHPGAHI